MKVFTLACSHNRKSQTLHALEDLHRQKVAANVELRHVLVDDASGDGTAEDVRANFPEVEVLRGSGSMYWAGGMRFGWEELLSERQLDYLFVYNDDARFNHDALQHLLDNAPEPNVPVAIVGSFTDLAGKKTTYGGRRRSSAWHPLKFSHLVVPDGTVQKADTLNMNGALISRGALAKVGFLSEYFIHSNADFEYGLKLRRAGGRVLVAPRHIGECDMNASSDLSPTDAPTLRGALRMLNDPKREPVRQRLNMYREHGGIFWPVLFAVPYITIWLQPLRRRFRRSDQP
ncbi:glycosyltransferase [Henriciella marina]|uniref:Glycosyltransferase n=1 Tax=Henriciella marina TaxID=453851 RepID=A0ABT4LWL7_9PROT|nr:glycosyltransferase [Henriciella marina]MCZ4297918.1 glycosyltransferase [Henriciella marina]